jgi:guanylate kinase
MLDTGAYVEATIYSGNVYGTSVAELLAARNADKVAIGDIEVQGVDSYRRIDPERTSAVFIVPPSYQVWQERLLGRYRGTIDQADYERRVTTARHELVYVLSSPYYYFVVNDVLTTAVAEIADIATTGMHAEERQAAGRQATERLLAQLDLSLPR